MTGVQTCALPIWRLVAAGLFSAEDLARAAPDDVAAAAGITKADATRLMHSAESEGHRAGGVAGLNTVELKDLQDRFPGATIDAIANKSRADLAASFGGNVERAGAFLNGINAGLLSRRSR